LLVWLPATAAAQEPSPQVIVPLIEGGFVGFTIETARLGSGQLSTGSGRSVLSVRSQALPARNHLVHRLFTDETGGILFAYDLWIQPSPSARQFRVLVKPFEPHFENQPRFQNFSKSSSAKAIPTFAKQTGIKILDDGDKISLDLLINEKGGLKIVDVIRATFDRSTLGGATYRSVARDLTLDAVELSISDSRLLMNGSLIGTGPAALKKGALLWLYVEKQGRFIFSLMPRAGYQFVKTGVMEDNRIEFVMNGNRYEWFSSAPILTGGGAWNLWVLHDPTYTPLFVPEPAAARHPNSWERLDANIENAASKIAKRRDPGQHGLSNDSGESSGPGKRLRVIVGGADRIEDLWPKAP
jgi:hypothetical protein